ncbi:MAG: hypothetical protein NTU49_04830, partial [Gammaproteobacteria bacterium]|nr:hypothetical protein [Gammaproteobacteria bacterium]
MRQIELTKQTLAILKKNKNLLIFSIINNFIALGLFTAVGIPIYRIESIAWKTNHLSPKMYFIYFGLILLLFSVHHFINMLFNAGLTHCAIKKLKGEKYKL